ncbi:outer membrane lipoprotein carrier protein LolA [Pseudomonas fluorescens]|uniref:outer membrane lipoprotein carrier protein LolA n=1 Tax=Pseudomonas fluorescens TaxID=294 RepID=UPI001BE8054B|nr:outer membrane lipoprotein carrier protein LolA [Pseudomonas fluorescens]MBT2370669.1 outer membrane lipoprotein carrier protein LolA [Pseudomonas fluorescens]
MRSNVGAAVRRFDLLAKVVNNNAGRLTLRGALRFFASKLAPAVFTLLGFSGVAQAFDLQQLSDQLAKPSVIHGNFIQEKHLRALPQPLTSKGTFVLARDHGLLWLLKTPLQQDYRISAQGIARRDANGWQLLPNKSAGAEQNRLFLAVLQGDSSGLQRDFELQLQGEAKQWKLTLIPRSLLLKQVFTQINIDGGELVQKIELLETQGDSTVLRMQDSTSSQPLSDTEQHDFAQ